MSETFNRWILSTRFKSIITMLEEIRQQIMNRIKLTKEFVESWICDISPSEIKKLKKKISIGQ